MQSENRMVEIGNGLQLSTRTSGDFSGPVILFANGSVFNFRLFDRIILPSLQKRFRSTDISTIMYDYVGIGKSSDLVGEYDFEVLAEQQKELMSTLGIDQVHLFGYSKGALINLIFTAKYPEFVNSLACYGAINLGNKEANTQYDNEYSTRLQNTKALEGIWEETIDERNFSLVYDTLYVPSIFNKQVFELSFLEKTRNSQIKKMLSPLLMGTKIESIHKLYQYYTKEVDEKAKDRFINGMQSISRPTLLMYGLDDKIVSRNASKLLHEWIPNSEYIEFKGFDHTEPMLTKQGKKIAKTYLQFLEKNL